MDAQIINFESAFSQKQLAFITESVAKEAKKVFGDALRQVILYGSYARGDHKDWSDVDIMILADVDSQTAKRLDKALTHALMDLNHHMNLLLSTIVVPVGRFEYFKEDLPFYRNINNEGVQIYAQFPTNRNGVSTV